MDEYRKSRAPKPPTEVGGRGIGSLAPKPSRVPHDPPMYFPSDLWLQTNLILLKAQKKFPHQTQTLEMCKHITAEMTAIFVEGVRAGKIEASAVQCERGGGMADLLSSILIHNAGGSGWGGLSNEAYRLLQEVQVSDEWLNMAVALAKQAEPTPAQNSGKTTPSEESKSPNKQHKALEDREQKLWEVIQRGLRGKAYCREVDAANVSPPRKGVWEGAPRTYVAAYVSRDQRLVHWIQNEKSKIRRKAELLGLA